MKNKGLLDNYEAALYYWGNTKENSDENTFQNHPFWTVINFTLVLFPDGLQIKLKTQHKPKSRYRIPHLFNHLIWQ